MSDANTTTTRITPKLIEVVQDENEYNPFQMTIFLSDTMCFTANTAQVKSDMCAHKTAKGNIKTILICNLRKTGASSGKQEEIMSCHDLHNVMGM